MYCSNCNKTFPQGTVFCDTCGSRLEADHAPEVTPEASPVSHTQGSYQPSPTISSNPAPAANPAPNPGYQSYQGYQSNSNPGYQSNYQAGAAQQPNTGYQNYNNPGYHGPTPAAYPVQPQNNTHMSTGKWLGIFCLNLIPGIGNLIYIILLFVWAFGSTKYTSLKTWAKATLVFMLIGVVIGLIIALVALPFIQDMIDNSEMPQFFYDLGL